MWGLDREQNDWQRGARELSELTELFYILFGVVVSQAYPITKTQTVLKTCALRYLYNIY